MCPDDIITQTKAQSRALACWLGSKKWLKYLLGYFFGYPVSIISNQDFTLAGIIFCTNGNDWLKFTASLAFSFICGVKCVGQQV